MDLYEKVAFGALLGAGARALGSGALNFGKGMFMAGPTLKAGLGGKAMNLGGKALAIGGPIASTMGVGQTSRPTASMGGFDVTASIDDRLYAIVKAASGGFGLQSPKDALDIASYAAMIGSKLTPHDNPWHARLEAGGLGGLAVSTGVDMTNNPDEVEPGFKDLAGLALFAKALHERTNGASGHGATLPPPLAP